MVTKGDRKRKKWPIPFRVLSFAAQWRKFPGRSAILWVLHQKRVLRRGFYSRRGSEKGVSRRCPERPLGEYASLGVRPIEVHRSISCQGSIGNPPASIRARNPKRVRKESERVSWGLLPREPLRPRRVRPGVRNPKLRFWTLFDSGAHSLGTKGLPDFSQKLGFWIQQFPMVTSIPKGPDVY